MVMIDDIYDSSRLGLNSLNANNGIRNDKECLQQCSKKSLHFSKYRSIMEKGASGNELYPLHGYDEFLIG